MESYRALQDVYGAKTRNAYAVLLSVYFKGQGRLTLTTETTVFNVKSKWYIEH